MQRNARGKMAMGLTTIDGSHTGAMLLLRFAGLALAGHCLCIQAVPLLAQSQQASPLPQGAIRVSVDRVNVGVIVTDAKGRFVEGLHREDFQIFDNGVEQPVAGFLPIEEPAQLVLLLECGPAAYFLRRNELHAADTLLNNLSPADQVAIAGYSKGPELFLDFTPDKSAARLSLYDLNFMAGFSQLNLSSSVVATLDWLASLPGKKSIVLLSTGVDTSSPEDWEILQRKLNTSDTRLLAVAVSGDLRKPFKHKKLSPDEKSDQKVVKQVFAQADRSLRALSEATGGRVYFPRNAKEFDRAYGEIAQLVRHEYSLAFVPPSHEGQLHSIEVKVKHSSYRVDHRQAYLAPPPDPQ
jgi:Ca-activated chloride channel family protein